MKSKLLVQIAALALLVFVWSWSQKTSVKTVFVRNPTPSVNVCGPVGEDSWQSLYSELFDEVVQGKREPLSVVQECSKRGDLCGGIGDRVRGLTNILFMAMLVGRALVIFQEKPSPLHHALLPNNEYFWWNVSEIPKEVLYWRHPNAYQDADNEFDYPIVKNARSNYPWSKDDIMGLKRRFYIGGTGKMFRDYPWPKNETIIRLMANAPVKLEIWHELRLTSFDPVQMEADPIFKKIRVALNFIQPENLVGCTFHYLFKLSPRMLAYLEGALVMTFQKANLNMEARPEDTPLQDVSTGKLHLLPVDQMNKIPISEADYNPRTTLSDHLRKSEKVTNAALSVLGLTKTTVPRLIGIHMRVSGRGRAGLKWNDTGGVRTNPDLLHDIIECAFTLGAIHSWSRREVKIILVSDDAEIRSRALETYPGQVLVPPLPDGPEHLDKPVDFDENGERTIETWSDILLLSLCDGLVLTNSGFGRLAASISFLPIHKVVHFGAIAEQPACGLRGRHTKSM